MLQDHVFNVCKSGLWWKKMLNKTFSKAECSAPGFKVAKDRLSLMYHSVRQYGKWFMVKAMLIYKSENHYASKACCLFFDEQTKIYGWPVLCFWTDSITVSLLKKYLKQKPYFQSSSHHWQCPWATRTLKSDHPTFKLFSFLH